MKTLHLYLIRQILIALVITVMVFTFVLLLGNALKEILPLLVSGRVRVGLVAQAVGLLVPWVWAFALPMGMLTATLLIFGRFSADQEFTAARASGISLVSLVGPILLLSLVLCGVSALVNLEIGPRSRVLYTSMLFKLKTSLSSALFPEDRSITDFPGYIFKVGKNRGGNLSDVTVLKLQFQTNVDFFIHAERGKFDMDSTNNRINVTLYGAKLLSLGQGPSRSGTFEEWTIPLQLESQPKGAFRPKIDDMTYHQLWAEMRDLEQRLRLRLPAERLGPDQLRAWKKQTEEWRKDLLTALFTAHRQLAYSFACFGFTLVGIPLAIRVQRRETNVGIGLALLFVALYYSFTVVGQAFETRPEYVPHLIVWLPNLLFEAVGMVLLWRANRGL